jgi:hypothetical protein
MVPVPEIAERSLARVHPQVHGAAAAAVAAVGSTPRDVGFSSHGCGTVSAAPGADDDPHLVKEHQGHSLTGGPGTGSSGVVRLSGAWRPRSSAAG